MESKSDMRLPEVNHRREKSNEMKWKLQTAIRQAIIKFEEDNAYKLEPFERDLVLIDMIRNNHLHYLNVRFGTEFYEHP